MGSQTDSNKDTIAAGLAPTITLELQEVFNKINHKTQIETLNQDLRQMKIFDTFSEIIG